MNTRIQLIGGGTRGRRVLWTTLALAVALTIAAALQMLATASASESQIVNALRTGGRETDASSIDDGGGPARAFGEQDGIVREGDRPTVFDGDLPAIGNLEPDLLDALQRAAMDAADRGVQILVNSGWRSAALQDWTLQNAAETYGSKEEAARWVATADTSLHVSGDAVDLGPAPALDWLSQRGAHFGLCQIYANESWHYELRPDAVDKGCPQMYADVTEDPRMPR